MPPKHMKAKVALENRLREIDDAFGVGMIGTFVIWVEIYIIYFLRIEIFKSIKFLWG